MVRRFADPAGMRSHRQRHLGRLQRIPLRFRHDDHIVQPNRAGPVLKVDEGKHDVLPGGNPEGFGHSSPRVSPGRKLREPIGGLILMDEAVLLACGLLNDRHVAGLADDVVSLDPKGNDIFRLGNHREGRDLVRDRARGIRGRRGKLQGPLAAVLGHAVEHRSGKLFARNGHFGSVPARDPTFPIQIFEIKGPDRTRGDLSRISRRGKNLHREPLRDRTTRSFPFRRGARGLR